MESVGTLSEFRPKIQRKVALEDSSALELTQDQLDDAIRSGLDFLSRYKPDELVHDQAGDNSTKRFVLSSAISSWVDRTFRVTSVERVTDVDTDDEYVEPYDLEDWVVTRAADGTDVLFLTETIGTGLTLRIHYVAPHAVQGLDAATATTVPQSLTEVLSFLCTSFAANTVASKAAEMKNLSLGADNVDFEYVHRRWLDIAQRRKNQALEVLAPSTPADSAGSLTQWESRSYLSPRGRIGH